MKMRIEVGHSDSFEEQQSNDRRGWSPVPHGYCRSARSRRSG